MFLDVIILFHKLKKKVLKCIILIIGLNHYQ
jgi:hypothetical protein